MTDEELTAIRANIAYRERVHEAVKGPENSSWRRLVKDCAALLAEVERLKALEAIARQIANEAAAVVCDDNFGYRCAFCDTFMRAATAEDHREPESHAPDCLVTQARAFFSEQSAP